MDPYVDSADHLADELRRADLLRQRWLESRRVHEVWSGERGDAVDGRRPSTHGDAAEVFEIEIRRLTDEIRERRRATAEEETELRLVALEDRFELDDVLRDALLLALAPDVETSPTDAAYTTTDGSRLRTVGEIVATLEAEYELDGLATATLLSSRSALVETGLLRVETGGPTSRRARLVEVDGHVLRFLLGCDDAPVELAGALTVEFPNRGFDRLGASDDRRASLVRLHGRYGRPDRERDAEANPLFGALVGPPGTGKGAVPAAWAATSARPLLRVDARELRRERSASVAVVLREARLRRGVVHVDVGDGVDSDPTDVATFLAAFDDAVGTVFVTSHAPLPVRFHSRLESHDYVEMSFDPPTVAERQALWDDADGLPSGADTESLAARFRLTSGQITAAADAAAALARERGEDPTPADVFAACRRQSRDRLDAVARRVEPRYTWDDIVLPADARVHLREVAARARNRHRVSDEWGFERRFSLGNGFVVLLTGPSGTGKTMAAEVHANDVGVDLYKIDLSRVVSKYVGETEKNLGEIFDGAAETDAILLFDEADSLFGERSTVRDAHDRYANVEVNYLLQRVEEHDGTVVLTTNLRQNIDDAFERRIHATLEFTLPDAGSRTAIWRRIFPPETPVGELDVEFLASFETSGGTIKNAALTGAFLAAADETAAAVEMRHVVSGLRRELRKSGTLVDPEAFADYASDPHSGDGDAVAEEVGT
jgi:AAA+ superfamily predicted ATPase